MRTYTRINEDYLDNSTIYDTEDISMHDEICSEIDRWIKDGTPLSFDLRRLPDAFFSVKSTDQLRELITRCCDSFGTKCDLNWVDVSEITDFSRLFCSSDFTGDISRWDVSNVTDMRAMFEDSDFNGNLSGWDVSRVRHMQFMFKYSSFNNNISEWDTSSVINMQAMFSCADKFNQNLSKWNVSSVENMRAMFFQSKFNGNLSGWDVSKVRYHECMFTRCPLEKKPDRQPKFKVNEDFLDRHDIQTDSINVLDDARAELDDWVHYGKEPSFNPEILPDGFYPVNKKIELQKLIKKAQKLIGLNCSLNWIDVSRITGMSWLFYQSLFNGDISRWDVSNVTDMKAMFYQSEFNGDISGWDVSKIFSMYAIFNQCPFCHDISMWNCASMKPGDLKRAL